MGRQPAASQGGQLIRRRERSGAVGTIGSVTSHRWRRPLALITALAAVLLSSCTSSSPPKKIGKCQVACTGTVDGAAYLIKMPADWNGTLLIYSHGYQSADAAPHAMLSPQDQSGTGDDELSATLLDKGFALAASAWTSTGWAVHDGVDAANNLYDRFTQLLGKPRRAYAWGSSLGGLVTELLAEHSKWVDGAAPMCGAVGGPLVNFDNWLEAAVATQALLGVHFTLTGTLSPAEAEAQTAVANAALTAARRDRNGGGAAKLVYLADLLGLPDKSSIFPRNGLGNEIGAALQNLAFYLSSGLKFLAEARQQFGGNPARTHPASEAPLTGDQRATIAALHGNPDAYAAQVDAAAAPPTSSAARQKLAASGNPTGDLRVPTLTLHGIDDPLAIAANEAVLSSRVASRGHSNRLEQLFVGPYTDDPTFGLGHCSFSTGEEVGLIETLDQWVRQGRPALNEIVDNLGPALDPSYSSPKWPSGAVA
jgi:hypothetical protein